MSDFDIGLRRPNSGDWIHRIDPIGMQCREKCFGCLCNEIFLQRGIYQECNCRLTAELTIYLQNYCCFWLYFKLLHDSLEKRIYYTYEFSGNAAMWTAKICVLGEVMNSQALRQVLCATRVLNQQLNIYLFSWFNSPCSFF